MTSIWSVMRPSEVEQALTRHREGEVKGSTDDSAAGPGSNIEGPSTVLEGLHAVLLLPAFTALQGSFPLNATYFQTNEVMMDAAYIKRPLLVPWEEIERLAFTDHSEQLPWKSLYFGFSASSICSKMGFAEVANLFHRSFLCIRAFEWSDGAHVFLPNFVLP